MAFFASPAKPALRRVLEERVAKAGVMTNSEKGTSTGTSVRKPLVRTTSTDSISREPLLGLSSDPERDVDEALSELKAEMEARARRASASKPLFNKI